MPERLEKWRCMKAVEQERIKNKGHFYDSYLNHSILLNGGTASVLISLVSTFGKENILLSIVLLVSALFFANNAAKAVESYFLRMEANDVPVKSEKSEKALKLAKKSMTGFMWTVRTLVLIAVIIQIFHFDGSKKLFQSFFVCMGL